MIITVASGKGGAGKTTVTASIAHVLPKDKTYLLDADVDTPNLALALGLEKPEKKEEWWGGVVSEFVGNEPHPEACPFGAIGLDGTVNELLCEGCGACAKRFPESYRLKNVHTADILWYSWNGVPLLTAELMPGRSGSGKIVTELRMRAEKEMAEKGRDVLLIDAAAGRGCPVIASLRGSDYAIIVVDNTPTGIEDALQVLNVVEHFSIPFGYVINRADIVPERVEKIEEIFGKRRGGEKLGEIPYIQDVLKTYPPPFERVLEYINVEEILKKI
ncbi:MAG: hypothetical protein PWP76_369 [Candidatus Diapherotrites archaeon]|nr:hypothetical protein [Candidatus Diapherotrites archaeon]MDN5366721.1 hypothetical protein [Candidatus Diapherotrites archaeon]